MTRTRHSGERRNPVTDHLDLWTSALLVKSAAGRGSNGRLEAYGTKKLRALILELAVRGKLVAQDQRDNSAVVAVKRARLKLSAEAKGARRSAWKETASVTEEEKRFNLPKGWAWARVNDTGFYINGLAFKPTDWGVSGKPIIRIQNLTDSSKSLNYVQGEFPDEVTVRTGDILVSWSATLDAFVWDRGEAVLNQHIFRVIACHELVTPEFLYWLLKVSIREMEGSDHAHGLVMTHINRQPFLAHVVAIPPLAEQRRIVAKVDELMALCDQLEQQQGRGIEAHQTLVETLLGILTHVESAQEFTAAWNRIAGHFDTLFTTEHSIDQLKQTILQLAVMGKLISQNRVDESVSKLLNRVVAERQAIFGAGAVEAIEGEEALAFNIPDSWRWQPLGNLLTFGPANGFSPKSVDYETPVRSLTLSATTSGKFNGEHFKFIASEIPDSSGLWLKQGDILVQRGNSLEYVGVSAVYRGNPKQFIFPDLMIKLRVSSALNVDYVHLAMSHVQARDYLRARATGTSGSMPKINQTTLKSLPIPVPPYAEQRRIVAKVDELMTLCDALKARLAEAQTTQIRLADAIVERAVAL